MTTDASGLVLCTTTHGITTLTLNLPARLNGWTLQMMQALKDRLQECARDETQAVILTGTDPYYSAGVNLSGSLRLAHPRTLHRQIVEHNQSLFESFIRFPKPILVACNGPAIGAVVTSATLCDGIVASDRATFSTPFAALGVTPEGCSSVLFERLMGAENAQRMLGTEGWKPTGTEAEQVGLVQWVVPHEALLAEAQRIAEGWVEQGRGRTFRAEATIAELLEINAQESIVLADAFLSKPFLRGQYEFLRRKKKRRAAAVFYTLWRTHRAWSRLL